MQIMHFMHGRAWRFELQPTGAAVGDISESNVKEQISVKLLYMNQPRHSEAA